MQENLDIDQIMAEIKRRAKERDFKEIPEFERINHESLPDVDFDLEAMQDEIRLMLTGYEITIGMSVSAGGAKGFIKRLIQKANRFWAEPMAAQQTGFNGAGVRVCRQLESYIIKQQGIIKSLESRISVLEKDSDH